MKTIIRHVKHLAALLILTLSALNANCAPLNVRVEGQGTPVLLFPGLACPNAVFDELSASLSQDYTLHRIEIPGFAGNSPMLEAGNVRILAQAVREYLRVNKIKRPALIGHSFGGFFATYLATQYPDEFGPVVSIDGVPFFSALFYPAATAKSSEPFAKQMAQGLLAASADEFLMQQQATLESMMQDSKRAKALAIVTARSDRQTIANTVSTMMQTDLRADLRKLTQPLLLIAAPGGFPPGDLRQQAIEAYRAQIIAGPLASLAVAENSRHFVQFDEPEWLSKTVHRFLAKSSRSNRSSRSTP
jgi:pimeloyl-ACP methyl ester carboxylesterase